MTEEENRKALSELMKEFKSIENHDRNKVTSIDALLNYSGPKSFLIRSYEKWLKEQQNEQESKN